jgi:hypothetical protein
VESWACGRSGRVVEVEVECRGWARPTVDVGDGSRALSQPDSDTGTARRAQRQTERDGQWLNPRARTRQYCRCSCATCCS